MIWRTGGVDRVAARAAALAAVAVLALGLAPRPQDDAPAAPAANPVPAPEPQAKPNPRIPAQKPGNNPNPNALLRNGAALRAGQDDPGVAMELAMVESMSHERLLRVDPPASLIALLPALDDPSFAVREKTSKRLLDRAFSDEAIWAVLDRFPLSAEARERLLNAAYRRVTERPRGALGIRMGTAPADHPGIVVQATLPGMPAEKFLRVGDVIEAVDGRAVSKTYDLVESIQNFPPGHEIKIQLRRTERDAQGRPLIGANGEIVERPVDLVMPLGNADDLDKSDLGDPRAAQNMQLQQRMLEARRVLRRFAAPAIPAGSPAADERP
jgi:hypothetical protein